MGTLLIAMLLATVQPAHAEGTSPQVTLVHGKKFRKRLLGQHRLTLQWLTERRPDEGEVTITNVRGAFRVKGIQEKEGDETKGLLTIEGTLTEASPKTLRLNGKVVTRVSFIRHGEPCVREGDLEFTAVPEKKAWRLRPGANPCDPATTDQIDIHFR